ncbi:MAG TPA: hypothetical protein DCR21_02265 [Succinivibrionaceae bacterium]|nr:hypothetical protein [Succinivibrionaceae bacterium]
MKTMSVYKSLLLALALAGSAAANAGAQKLTIVNHTPDDLTGIFISEADSQEWSENFLPDGFVLVPERQITVKIKQYHEFDIHTRYGDRIDHYEDYPGTVTLIELKGRGRSNYE